MTTASISTVGRAARARLPEGKMTWKKMNKALIIKLGTLIVLD